MRFLFIAAITFLLQNVSAQTFTWLETIRPGGNEYAWDLITDTKGNVLATGRVKAYSTFGSGSNVQQPAAISLYETDMFIAKYGPEGDLKWVKREGGIDPDWGRGVASDNNDNVFVAGDYCDTAVFGGTMIVGVGGIANRNIFFVKYDSLGNGLWAKTAGNIAASSRAYSVTVDEAGNSYISGVISGVSNFDGISFGLSGKNSPFIAKFNSSGTCIWAKTLNTQYGGEAIDVKYREGRLYVTGYYKGILNINGTQYPGQSTSWGDVFLTLMDTAGNFNWVRTAIGAYQDQANGVTIDSEGNAYIMGTFANDLIFPSTTLNVTTPGSTASAANANVNVFVAKYSASGTFQWARTILDSVGIEGDEIAITPNNQILVVSGVRGKVDLAGNVINTGTSNYSGLVSSFNKDGTLKWFKLIGGGGSSNMAEFRTVGSDDCGTIYIGGEYAGPSLSFDSLIVPSGNGWDGFIAKLIPPIQPEITPSTLISCPSSGLALAAIQDGCPLSYAWSFPGATDTASTSPTPTIFYNSAGTYQASLILSNSIESDTIQFNITVPVSPSVSLGPDTVVCEGALYTLDPGSNYSSYSWNDGTNAQTLTVDTNGLYTINVTDVNGCVGSDTVLVTFDICIGAEELKLPYLTIYPNPAEEIIIIRRNRSDNNENVVLKIFSATGQLAVIRHLSSAQETLDISNLAPGIYYYLGESSGYPVINGKFIKR